MQLGLTIHPSHITAMPVRGLLNLDFFVVEVVSGGVDGLI